MWDWGSIIKITNLFVSATNTEEVSTTILKSFGKGVNFFDWDTELKEVEDLLFSKALLVNTIHQLVWPDLWINLPVSHLKQHSTFVSVSNFLDITDFRSYFSGSEVLDEDFILSELDVKLSLIIMNISIDRSPKSTQSLLFASSFTLGSLTVGLQVDTISIISSWCALNTFVIFIVTFSIYSWFALVFTLGLAHFTIICFHAFWSLIMPVALVSWAWWHYTFCFALTTFHFAVWLITSAIHASFGLVITFCAFLILKLINQLLPLWFSWVNEFLSKVLSKLTGWFFTPWVALEQDHVLCGVISNSLSEWIWVSSICEGRKSHSSGVFQISN